MATEVELKLALPQAAQRAFLKHPLLGTAQPLPARRLVNVYFDTPGLDLRRRGIALRTRRQGRRWLQTVKCTGTASGGLSRRPEWEQPYAGRFDFSAIDDPALRAMLERHRLGDSLQPVFETIFVRRGWRLQPGRGNRVLLLLDRGRILAGGREEALSELEIELEAGEGEALFEPALILAADLPLAPAPLSKAERGYRLAEGAPLRPLRAAASPLRPAQAPAEAFGAIAAACLGQLQWNAQGAVGDDSEFIHQMRVALRRLRSALRLFRPALPADFEPAVVPSLRRLARALGEARDWDVLAETIVGPAASAFADDPRLAALAAAVERRRQAARADLRQALAEPGYALAVLDCQARLLRLAADPAAPALREFAARRLRRLHRKVVGLAAAARDLDPRRLHALRIGVKRLRYALEFLQPLHPDGSGKRLRRLAALQDRLGALNDLAGAGPLLSRCLDDEPALREAVSLVGGWHGPRYAVLRRQTFRGIAELGKTRRFWKED